MRGVNALAAEKRALSASDPDVEEAAERSLALKLQMQANQQHRAKRSNKAARQRLFRPSSAVRALVKRRG